MHTHQKTAFFQNALGVFQGGGCCGVALAGAFESASQHGVQFSEVAGASAGSIVAAIVGAGADASTAVDLVRKLDFKQFMGGPDRKIGKKRPLLRLLLKPLLRLRIKNAVARERVLDLICHQGMHSPKPIADWVESALRQVLKFTGRAPVTFEQLRIPTSIVATDVRARRVKVWSSSRTLHESVAHAVSASCSIPLFFQPVEGRYVDGGALSNLPTFVFSSDKSSDRPSASRVLAFTLVGEERQAEAPTGIEDYLLEVTSTIVEGSVHLQGGIQEGIHTIQIPTGTVETTDFDKMTPDTVSFLINSGKDAADAFFAEESIHIKP